MSVCLLLVVPCRSLDIARSLLRFGSVCGEVLRGEVYSAVKAFQYGGWSGFGRFAHAVRFPACSYC